jgi:predicted nucleic acid-binding protein
VTTYLILDTGPLIAALNPHDPLHEWSEEQLRISSSAFITCEAVIAETAYFLSKWRRGIGVLFKFLEEAPVHFPFSYAQNRIEIRELIEKYSDVPMSFADACLVRLSELYPDAPILTLDSDFLIYRRNKNERLPVLIPKERAE